MQDAIKAIKEATASVPSTLEVHVQRPRLMLETAYEFSITVASYGREMLANIYLSIDGKKVIVKKTGINADGVFQAYKSLEIADVRKKLQDISDFTTCVEQICQKLEALEVMSTEELAAEVIKKYQDPECKISARTNFTLDQEDVQLCDFQATIKVGKKSYTMTKSYKEAFFSLNH